MVLLSTLPLFHFFNSNNLARLPDHQTCLFNNVAACVYTARIQEMSAPCVAAIRSSTSDRIRRQRLSPMLIVVLWTSPLQQSLDTGQPPTDLSHIEYRHLEHVSIPLDKSGTEFVAHPVPSCNQIVRRYP